MQFSALIYSVEKECFFTLLLDGKKTYFYMQKHLCKSFLKYLRKGTFVTFEFDEKKAKHKKISSYSVSYFYTISYRKKNGKNVVYYDINIVKDGIRDLVNSMNPILFVDYEMNMQDYKAIPNFVQEVIEAGFVLTDKNGAIRNMKHIYIKPTKFPLTKRTIKFLQYTKEEVKNAISFPEYIGMFKTILEEYHPHVVVWGKSDITTFKKCLDLNGIKEFPINYVNLLQLHINYDNLKDSPGLFSCYEAYTGKKLGEQAHDSLEDAMVTKDVFFEFKKKVNK